MTATYTFLPFVRRGVAAGHTNVDGLGPTLAARLRAPVSLRVNGRPDTAAAHTLRLAGPGDVSGIDIRVVIHNNPPHGTAAFEPNYFAHIEFDRPDFPWLFTPAAAGSRGKLRPWLCLVVVRHQRGVSLTFDRQQPLPVLSIADPAIPDDELPDLAESWAWAHGQVVLADGSATQAAIEDVLFNQPDLNLSRLICPRRLRANERYLACVVPAFEAGRLAGLGRDVPDDQQSTLRPAWGSGPNAPPDILLPVYYHWEFSTGLGGDFESLVRLLATRPLPAGVGKRPMRVEELGFGLPDLGLVELEGALRAPGPPPALTQPAEVVAPFRAALRDLLNLPERLRAAGPGDDDPLVAPPIYGHLQAAQTTVPPAEEPPQWLGTLNLDPRHRAAAGLGTLVVQDQQESLVAAAWNQLGDERRTRRLLNRLPFARVVLKTVHEKRLAPLTPQRLLQFTGPLHARTRLSPETVLQYVRESVLTEAAVAAPFRRAFRPRGPVQRQVVKRGAPPVSAVSFMRRLTLPPVIFQTIPRAGMVNASHVGQQVSATQTRILAAEQAGIPADTARRFLDAVQDVQQYFANPPGAPSGPGKRSIVWDDFKHDLLHSLDPGTTVTARVMGRLGAGPSALAAGTADPSALSRDLPSFPQPMYEALRDLSQDFLLPGAGDIPADTVTLLETNTPFVEAYLVGLNHEMGRELLWREFPNEQHQTYFQTFWDGTRTARATGQIPRLHEWLPESDLGQNFRLGGQGEKLVLLIRGQLLLRYPDAIIYAVRADSPTKLGTEERHPLFRGRLRPDMTFLGFDLSEEEARAQPGWFFVLQEQPTSPRFGLDVSRREDLSTWDTLSWQDLPVAEDQHLRLAEITATVPDPGDAQWAFNAAHMAAILRQRPARVAIHANLLLTPPEEPDEED